MKAEGMANRKNSLIPLKISMEIGARVFAQILEYLMNKPRIITFSHMDIPIDNAAPTLYSPDLNTSTQHRGTCTQKVRPVLTSKGKI